MPDEKIGGIYSKKIQVFNNSVGYASKEDGGNLIVKEQWLEKPSWTIYLLNEGSINQELFVKLKDYLLNSKATYIPYLGKNDHPANISDVELINVIKAAENIHRVNSIVLEKDIELDFYEEIEGNDYYIKEVQPYKLEDTYNFYEFDSFIYTNVYVKKGNNLYLDKEKVLYFY